MGYQVINIHKSIKSLYLYETNYTSLMKGIYDYEYKYPMKFVPLISIKEFKSPDFEYKRGRCI